MPKHLDPRQMQVMGYHLMMRPRVLMLTEGRGMGLGLTGAASVKMSEGMRARVAMRATVGIRATAAMRATVGMRATVELVRQRDM
jgi:hypothetical protein